jgi:hypothetical protein
MLQQRQDCCECVRELEVWFAEFATIVEGSHEFVAPT